MQDDSKKQPGYISATFAILLCIIVSVAAGFFFHKEPPEETTNNKTKIEELQAKIEKIKELGKTIAQERETLGEKKDYFKDKIEEIQEELLFEKGDLTWENNRLDNYKEYDVYLRGIKIRLEEIAPMPDKFLSIERHFNASIAMLGLKSDAKFDELKNQIAKFIKDNSYQAQKSVIDISKIPVKSREELLKEMESLRKKYLEQKSNYYNYTKNKLIWEEMCDGIFYRANQVTDLSPKAARCALKTKDDILDLKKLVRLRPRVAKILTDWDGEEINLDSLKRISILTAKYLSLWKGGSKRTYLKLNGLTSISPPVAKYLSKAKATHLELDGITSLSRKSAMYLSRGNYYHLSLEGIEKLKSEVGVYIANYKGTLDASYKIKERIYNIQYLAK